jgi:ABC-2 type transport system ATP-binding protein
MPVPMLIVQNLAKSYGTKPALKGVSFTIQAGEMVALLGPNGAGKSTLLQLLTGLFSPDQGTIEVFGQDLRANPSQALAGMGVVFQQSALDLDLTANANLLFHTDLHGLPRRVAQQRIADGLSAMGLQDKAREVVRSLSGGTRRKVELVRALLHQPRVLLMDEATVGLDPESRANMLAQVRQLATQNQVGVLWATHMIEEIKVTDRVLCLEQGLIRFDGSPAAYFAQFKSHAIPNESNTAQELVN